MVVMNYAMAFVYHRICTIENYHSGCNQQLVLILLQ